MANPIYSKYRAVHEVHDYIAHELECVIVGIMR